MAAWTLKNSPTPELEKERDNQDETGRNLKKD
jgi:hypothetical protein